MWNFIRLENEHLNNCGQFRIVRDISIAPVEMKVIVEKYLSREPRHRYHDVYFSRCPYAGIEYSTGLTGGI